MKSKIDKIGAIFLAVILFGTTLFVPASSVKVENKISLIPEDIEEEDLENLEPYGDSRYIIDPVAPLNRGDNDDAGYKRDAGDEQSRAYAIYPGEMIDDLPGRGNTGKMNTGDEDWYFFSACTGQQIEVTMTPESGYNFDLCLWNDDEVEVATSTNSGSSMESISYTADMTDKWYIGLLFISGPDNGEYSFDVNLVGQNDANSGLDAPDNFADAYSITPDTYYGYLDMNDEEDWYKFSANSGQGIHITLELKSLSYLSDYDVYLYSPSGDLKHYEAQYYDDELLFPADESGQWRMRIKTFPGYTDIPTPTDWDYYTYGSGAYTFNLAIEGSAPAPPGPIPQPDITPIAQTFKVINAPDSNVDEYGYLASIPANNYLDGGQRYLAPIVYQYDDTPTNWFGTVDDTTDYLLSDWDDYLTGQGKTAVEYYLDSDPVSAAGEIATQSWVSSDLAVIAVDGSSFEDTIKEVLRESTTLSRSTNVETIPNDSPDFIEMGDRHAYVMQLGNKYGAIHIEISGGNEEPSLMGIWPHYMKMAGDWWPEHVNTKDDIYYPITTAGIWAAGVGSVSSSWDMILTKFECDRYKIKVDDDDSVLTATVTTSTPSDLLVFLIDPQGNIRAPDIPDWNGGPINPIHEWNGMDDPGIPPDCDDWSDWIVEDHSEFTAEVLHPETGEWTAIVVPRYTTGASSISYTISGTIREVNPNRANAAISAANAAVIASQEHVPLLYIRENSVPAETQSALTALGVDNVILVHKGNIASGAVGDLPPLQENLKTMQEIVDHIKGYSHSENYITITSLKSGDGYFAPAAMAAAYHCSPVLRINDAEGATGGGKKVFVGKIDEKMYAFDTESKEFIWSDPIGWTPVDPNIYAPENSVYLGSSEDFIFCIDSEDWGITWSNPEGYKNVATDDCSIYFSTEDMNIQCFNEKSGINLWTAPLSSGGGKGPAEWGNQIDSWRLWAGDYYHGNRAPGHLPFHDEPLTQLGRIQLLIELLKFLSGSGGELPVWGQDARRYWNAKMHDGVKDFISGYGLDLSGQEAYLFVAPRKDIRLEVHAVMIGENSYAGHIPGTTPSYANDIIIRNILYPAVIYANPNRDVTTAQIMNFADGTTWRTNDEVSYSVYSSRVTKNAFMSHGRKFDGHCLWEAHLERMNDGVSVMYYSGHGTGGSGMSAQYLQSDLSKYPEQIWFDSWRSYMYDNWKTPRDNGRRWFNAEPPMLYDLIHYKWHDQLFENLRSAAIYYKSCSTGQQFAPMVYLDHGALIWHGNAGTSLSTQAELLNNWLVDDTMIHGLNVGEAYSQYVWLHQRDYTIPEGDPHFEESMYGPSTLYGDDGITTVPVIFGDPNLIMYSPEWTEPAAIDSPITGSTNQQPLAPDISGPLVGKPRTQYTFEFVTTDPDGDDIEYFVDWGDGDTEDWDGPYASGEVSSASHTFGTKAFYNIKVKARDSNGAEGPWGVHTVNMPRAKAFSHILEIMEIILQRFPMLESILNFLLKL